MSSQNPALTYPHTPLYNVDLIQWRKRILGLTVAEILRRQRVSRRTMTEVLQGRASSKSVYKVASVLGLNWALVHELSLPEDLYYLAVQYAPSEGRQLIAPTSETSNSP